MVVGVIEGQSWEAFKETVSTLWSLIFQVFCVSLSFSILHLPD